MDWMNPVLLRHKRGRRILFSPADPFFQDLPLRLEESPRRTQILWAFEFAGEAVSRLKELCPAGNRAEEALRMAKLWAAGEIKMPEAKRAILNCHALAKETENPEAIALCHAVGQACGVVHTGGHAMGLPIYELTALVHRFGIGYCREAIERRRQEYLEKLLFWAREAPLVPGPWAGFLQE